MGGVGKTTIAAALVNDDEVRAAFDYIAWASLGQDPDKRELQSSIHFQITGQELPEAARTDREVMAALQNATKGSKVLLVLDDVWDASHERALNCIDPETDSRLLVTTRIRGLLNNSAEVELGVLPRDEALELLQGYADIKLLKGDERQRAIEIVELSGRLPLTLAIAGGMLLASGSIISEEFVEMMNVSKLRASIF